MKRLFVTTKNLDYIRNVQEIKLLKEKSGLDVIGSSKKGYVKRLLSVYFGLISTNLNQYDEVFVGFAPQLVIPLFKGKFNRYKKNGGRLKIDFFISVYDTLVCDRKKFSKGSLAARLIHNLDEKTIRFADKIIVDTKAHGKYFVDEFGADEGKIEVLYLEADENIYHPTNVKKRQEWKDKCVVLYFGSILPLQGVDVILDAIRLMENDQSFHFVMIGPIDDEKKVKTSNVTYYDWMSQKDLANAIAEADVCLAGHFNSEISKASRTIPGKAYIYKAMGKPMILGDNPANRELFDESDDKIKFCKMGDATDLMRVIKNEST